MPPSARDEEEHVDVKKMALIAWVGALLVAAAACGGSSDGDATSASTTATTVAAAAETSTSTAPTTSAAPAPTTTAAAANPVAPAPSGATQERQDAISEGGQHTYYVTSEAPAQVVAAYQATLQAAGWTVEGSGGGGYGEYGGGGLTASQGASYLVMNAGGGDGQTHIDICSWPARPAEDGCGSDG
jgi:hypothetical protein